MSDLQIPWIKKLKMFIIFVSMPTELTDRQNFTKTAILMQIILFLQTEIMIMSTHSGKSTSD